jgi:hypothetical protein
LEERDTLDIIKILVAANELNIQELIAYIQTFLIKNKVTWMEQNFNLIYQTSFGNDSFLELQKYCNELISKKPDKIFNSLNFTSITKNLLVSLIQSDNHQMREIQVWEHVLKWGLAQNPELPSDLAEFSRENFSILKDTLQQCIPFIKFYNLTAREFSNSVLPYREILPEELFLHLLNLFLDSDYKPTKKLETKENKPEVRENKSEVKENKPEVQIIKEEENKSRNIDSKIITDQHAELISKWINRLEISDEIKSCEFKLLLRGSRDGFSASKFHETCDNQSHTVSIVKLKDSNEILGGYNPSVWKSDHGYSTTNDSFIFSFMMNDRIENCILSRVRKGSNAIFNNPMRGPSFGKCSLGKCDLILSGENGFNNSFCIKTSYEKPIRKTGSNFSVEEFEVFKIIIGGSSSASDWRCRHCTFVNNCYRTHCEMCMLPK